MITITGMHYCLPPEVVTNKDLGDKFGHDKVKKVTDVVGIQERRVGGSALETGFYAAKHLMSQRGTQEEIGLVLFLSESGDFLIPSNACVLHGMLGLREDCLAFDMAMGCSGWPYAIEVASSIMEHNSIDCSLVVNADAITKFLDPDLRGLNCIHGNGSAATLLRRNAPDGIKVIGTKLGTCGKDWHRLYLRNNPDGGEYVFMDGAAIAHFAARKIPEVIREAAEGFNVKLDELDTLLLHQANRQIIGMIYDQLGIPESKQRLFLENVGNLSNASTPALIAETWRNEKLGKVCMTCSFGAGLSWGSTLLVGGDSWLPVVGPVEQTELEKVYTYRI